MRPKIRIQSQGKIIMDADGPGWLMMTPNGELTFHLSRAAAEKAAKSWFHKHLDPSKIGAGVIEWRS